VEERFESFDMIIKNDESVLRIKCTDVLSEEVGQLISLLELELYNSNKLGDNSIGLAASQIGIAKNIAIIRTNNSEFNINLVNCKIKRSYDPTIFKDEGCLSFPGRVEDTIRFQEVYVVDNFVEPHNFIATGLLAAACQHEIDHFNGKIFYDYVKKVIKVQQKLKSNDICYCGKIDSKTGNFLKFKKCCGKVFNL